MSGKLVGYYTCENFPHESILLVMEVNGVLKYWWEFRDVTRQECHPSFVRARSHAWKYRAAN